MGGAVHARIVTVVDRLRDVARRESHADRRYLATDVCGGAQSLSRHRGGLVRDPRGWGAADAPTAPTGSTHRVVLPAPTPRDLPPSILDSIKI